MDWVDDMIIVACALSALGFSLQGMFRMGNRSEGQEWGLTWLGLVGLGNEMTVMVMMDVVMAVLSGVLFGPFCSSWFLSDWCSPCGCCRCLSS